MGSKALCSVRKLDQLHITKFSIFHVNKVYSCPCVSTTMLCFSRQVSISKGTRMSRASMRLTWVSSTWVSSLWMCRTRMGRTTMSLTRISRDLWGSNECVGSIGVGRVGGGQGGYMGGEVELGEGQHCCNTAGENCSLYDTHFCVYLFQHW